ncbi:expressed protein [Phakopsora pachyrhizi]|uniref:Expressed protein n=1 Tax=Phakopsora pachyrhizi TaxID=170000 RepID=A0AAV0BSY7_PHAPC|nr:expressed protein [Phakopsora pachyrhizi]
MRIAWTLCISSIFVEACSGNFITRGSRLERKSYKPSTIQDFVQLKLNREFKLKVDRKAEILNEETIKNKESDRDSDLIRLREAWQSLELDSKKYQPCLNEETHLLQFDGNFKKTLECLKEINEFAKEHNNNFVYKFMLLTDDVLLINLDEKLGFQEIVGYIRHCLEGLNNLESINTENHEKLFLQLLNYLTQHRIINPSEICHLIEDPDQIFTKFLARHLHLRIEGAKSHFLWPSYRDMFLYSSETKDFQNLLRGKPPLRFLVFLMD